ncbi:MAG: hypothetical protein OEY97_13410, partial [Nitrospirota bacterium]|nr:hypothetical protein [Nitrospirota bacterium]
IKTALWGRFAPWVSHVHGDLGTEYQGVLKAGSTMRWVETGIFPDDLQNPLKLWKKRGFVAGLACETKRAEGIENVGITGFVGTRFTVGPVWAMGVAGVREGGGGWNSFHLTTN